MTEWIEPVDVEHARNRGSKKKLRPGAQRHYPSDSGFDRLGRAVCRAGCIPRKELYESWEFAKRVRRNLRGTRIIDLACGHGLVAYMLAVITPAVPEVLASDRKLPPSAARLAAAMEAEWPELAKRVTQNQHDLRDIEIRPDDLVVCVHGCGSLTDRVLDLAINAGADVGVMPCCADHSRQDTGELEGWLGGDLAIDVTRAVRLRAEGYRVWTLHIDAEITPKNRILLGRSPAAS